MIFKLIGLASLLAAAAPVLAIPGLFLIFYLKRATARRKKRKGRSSSGFSPSTFALGLALQHLQMTFTHPSIQYVLEQKYDEETDQDDQGDPDHPKAQLHRQLKRIRRGESVDRLLLRQK